MLSTIIAQLEVSMEKAIEHYQVELIKISTGQSTPALLDGINVDYYGVTTPLNQIAIISAPEARQLLVKPYDKSQLKIIASAIIDADLGLNPNNEGELLRITIPILTEETRIKFAKDAKVKAEDAKIVIRNLRKDANEKIKHHESSEDDQKGYQNDVQELTNKFNKKIDDIYHFKKDAILSI